MRAFAEHYAVHGDGVAALLHAYPAAEKWQSQSRYGQIARLRAHPAVQAHIDEIRKPTLERYQLNFEKVQQWAIQCFQRIADKDDPASSREQRAWIKLFCRFVGADHAIGRERDVALPSPVGGNVIDADFSALPADKLIELAYPERGAGGGQAAGTADAGAELPAAFRAIRERPGTAEAPRDLVLGAAGDSGRPDAEGDGVHAAGRGEVDLHERIRASIRGGPATGHCPHCGKSHAGACPAVR
jgi:hypothetical protein